MIGDAVNVASRLEQLNKRYRSSIIIGPNNCDVVMGEFVTRPLEFVLLKGKSEPTKVHELLCRRLDATEETLFLADQSTKMLNSFAAAECLECMGCAEDILKMVPSDVPAQLMLEQCATLMDQVLPSNWSPVHKLNEK